ncbi:hypothetical protein E5163_10415 [Marinicauda algicola]|uniref:Holdfast attachment protein D n=1 Tax=Marinicauda algicola TaxID=2029849 RepID=A0A4S2GYN2_9PROT|nr:holdfast anchor protein HfaD [Marinicauda algicola]TGY88236.1 hypothetical protein E5163_10415 [Marinicauda algicola]
MSRLARALIAGTSAATLISAPSFAGPISNDQTNDAPETAAESVQALDSTEAATGLAIAQANSATGVVLDWSQVTSGQVFTGDVRAESIIEADNVWGIATGHANAQGNALTVSAGADLDLDASQSAGTGTVSALSALRLGEYAGHAVMTAQGAANAIEVAGNDADMDLRIEQSSGTAVQTRAVIEADSAEIETSLVTASSAGNSVNAGGIETDTEVELAQSNTGAISATAEADIANADYGVTGASQAAGNTATVRNEWGYARIEGEQLNSGEVEAITRLGVGAFENGAAVGSANAVGNSVLLSNFGADAYAGVGQVNSGNVSGRVVMEGGWGHSAFATSSAIGNAQSAYICSECPVSLDANMSQTNSGNVYSGVSQTYGGYVGAVTGSATAVGNAATFSSTEPN